MCLLAIADEDIRKVSSLLQTLFSIKAPRADRLAHICLSKSPLTDCEGRLNLLHASMGLGHGSRLIISYPHLLSRDLSALPGRLAALQTHGFPIQTARQIILDCPEIICMTEEAFQRQSDVLHKLFPDSGIRRAFLAFKPRIFLIPPDHLRYYAPLLFWDQTAAEGLWDRILHPFPASSPSSSPVPETKPSPFVPPTLPPPAPIDRPKQTPAGAMMERIQNLIQAIMDKGASTDTACALAQKMTKARIERPFESMTFLLDAGWSFDQIRCLCDAHPRVLQEPDLTLQAESAMIQAGFSAKEARDSLCTRGPWLKAEAQALGQTIRAMFTLGVSSKDIQHTLRRRPSLIGADKPKLRRRLAGLFIPMAAAPKPEPSAAAPPLADPAPQVRPQTEPPPQKVTAHVPPLPASFPPPPMAEEEPAFRTRDWLAEYRELLAVVHPGWNAEKTEQYLKQRTRLLDRVPAQEITIEILGQNVPLPLTKTADNPAVVWFCALLSDPGLSGILDVPPEAMQFRVYAVKRVLGCDLLRNPTLLALPFESVRHPSSPPDDKDVDAVSQRRSFHLILDELRFRKNEIESRGKQPQRKPYVDMMVAGSREKFLHRLRTHLKEPADGFKPPPFRREVLRPKGRDGI